MGTVQEYDDQLTDQTAPAPENSPLAAFSGDKAVRIATAMFDDSTDATALFEQMMADHGLTQDEIEPVKERMLKEIRACEFKEARKAQNLTRQQLAHALGVSKNKISRIESGDIDKIEMCVLREYLEMIGCKLQVNALMPDGRTLQLI